MAALVDRTAARVALARVAPFLARSVSAGARRCGRPGRCAGDDLDDVAHAELDVVVRAAEEIDARIAQLDFDAAAGIERAARIVRAQDAVSAWGERKAGILRPIRRRRAADSDDVERMRRRCREIRNRDGCAGRKRHDLRRLFLRVSADGSPDGIVFDADLSGRDADADAAAKGSGEGVPPPPLFVLSSPPPFVHAAAAASATSARAMRVLANFIEPAACLLVPALRSSRRRTRRACPSDSGRRSRSSKCRLSCRSRSRICPA